MVNRFGRHFAHCIKRDRPPAADKWHVDEVVITIKGRQFWLWRAIDASGDMLDIHVQAHRNAKAARRFLSRLIARFGQPRVIITDKLRSYRKPIRAVAPGTEPPINRFQTAFIKLAILNKGMAVGRSWVARYQRIIRSKHL